MPDLHAYVKAGAPVILSGIIESRAQEVRECVLACGYRIVGELYENDWVAMKITRDI
jgi:ribosomal protein L11 methylase PrmA